MADPLPRQSVRDHGDVPHTAGTVELAIWSLGVVSRSAFFAKRTDSSKEARRLLAAGASVVRRFLWYVSQGIVDIERDGR